MTTEKPLSEKEHIGASFWKEDVAEAVERLKEKVTNLMPNEIKNYGDGQLSYNIHRIRNCANTARKNNIVFPGAYCFGIHYADIRRLDYFIYSAYANSYAAKFHYPYRIIHKISSALFFLFALRTSTLFTALRTAYRLGCP